MQPAANVTRYDLPADWFVRPGIMRLSPAALAAAKEMIPSLKMVDAGANWIVGLQWCLARTMRWTADGETFDEGPGVDPAGFRDTEIPTDAVQYFSGVPIVFILPPDKVVAAKAKTIVEVGANSGRATFALE